MINLLKYIGVPLIGIVLVFLTNYLDGQKLSKAAARRLRLGALALSVVAIIVQGVVTWNDDREADAQHKVERTDLQTRIDDLKVRNNEIGEELTSTRNELAETRKELCTARAELAQANSNIQLQSRSIGSLVFNLGTSEEGKRRFARCFKDISLITERRDKPLVYEGLICKDGVAMFGFEQEPERLKEFYFFTESEVNYVLSGTQLEDHFINEDGKVRVRAGSELALISQMIEKRLPNWCDDEIEQSKAMERIDDQMEIVLRYAYRAVNARFGWMRFVGTQELSSRFVAFSYAANPLAKHIHILSAEIEIPKAGMKELFGLSIRDFNARLIDRLYANGIEPKVRARDVRGLNARLQNREQTRTSPYQ